MSLDYFKYRFLRFAPKNPGALLDSPETLKDLPRHELFAGGGEGEYWKNYCPPFRNQGPTYYCTAYVATAIGALFEKKESGKDVVFSPGELFNRDPWGGSIRGNYLLYAANAAKDGFVFESDVPTIVPDNWSYNTWVNLKSKSQATPNQLLKGKEYRIKEAAIVQPTYIHLQEALLSSPLSIAIPIGAGYWDKVAPNPPRASAWHNVLLVGFDGSGNYIIFDSLAGYGGFDGFHKLNPDYPISYAMSFIDLPNGWKKEQEKVTQVEWKGALDHYGEKRNLRLEQQMALVLADLLKPHPTLSTYFGRTWTVCVNAITYGDYSVTDLLNHFTSVRRGQGAIFDLNKKKK